MSVRDYNVGNSDYSKHKIQPWEIWIQYKLNPFDADILKRTLRTKAENGLSKEEARELDYKKIIHISQERIRQIDEGIHWYKEKINPTITLQMIVNEYNLNSLDSKIVEIILERKLDDRTAYLNIIKAVEEKDGY